jgi:hypothetical protein
VSATETRISQPFVEKNFELDPLSLGLRPIQGFD